MSAKKLPVAIIGGGPVGMAAAAHLVSYGKDFVLFESGAELGASFLDYGRVRLFSSWRYNVDAIAKKLLESNGFQVPNGDAYPIAQDIATKYLKPLGALPELAPYIHLNSRVIHLSRKGLDRMKDQDREKEPFLLEVEQNGRIAEYEASAIIDATGTWQSPNPLISGGMPHQVAAVHYRLPDILKKDRSKFAGKNIAVAGSGHSSFNSLLDLVKLKETEPATNITWIIRRKMEQSLFGGGASDQLAARGELGNRVKENIETGKIAVLEEGFIRKIQQDELGRISLSIVRQGTGLTIRPFDEVIANTGSRPDFSFLREIRYTTDPSLESAAALAPLIDPNVHSCGTVRAHGEKELRQPEKDFYIVGAKSYGRAPTFLMATGYEQVRSIVAHLSGDSEAAARTELTLPETGVCSSRPNNLLISSSERNVCC